MTKIKYPKFKLQELNSLDLSDEKGTRIYYNKTFNWLTILLYCTLTLIFIICGFILAKESSKVEYLLGSLFFFGYIGYFSYRIVKTIEMLRFKNPIYIFDIHGERIYYTRHQNWYSLKENKYKIVKNSGKLNWWTSFKLMDPKGELIFSESNLHIGFLYLIEDELKKIELIKKLEVIKKFKEAKERENEN